MSPFARRLVGSAGLVLALAGSIVGSGRIGPGFLSVVLLAVGLMMGAAGVVLNRKEIASTLLGGGMRAGTSSAFYATVVLGVVVLANFIANRHHIRKDLSAGRAFSLSEFSRNVVGSLDGPIRIIGFFRQTDDENRNQVSEGGKNLIREYGFLSSKVQVDSIDPLREPGMATRYAVRQDPTIVVEKGDRFVQATAPDEESLTSAIITMTQQRRKKVLFLGGHGERIPSQESGGYSLAAKALAGLNYEVGDLLLSRQNVVPPDCDVLVIAGPQGALLPEEDAAISGYLQHGGRLLAMTEPLSPNRLDSILAPWGLRALPQVIADRRSSVRGSVYTPVVNKYEDHPMVRSFGSSQTLFPTVGPVEWFETKDQLIFHSYLARTGPDAWGDSDLEAVRRGDAPTYHSTTDRMEATGLPVGAVAFRRTWQDVTLQKKRGEEKQETRVVLFGDSEFACDAHYSDQWNGNLFLNAVNWLAQEEVFIGKRQSANEEKALLISPRHLRKLLTILVTPPVVMGLVGIAVWWRRRKL